MYKIEGMAEMNVLNKKKVVKGMEDRNWNQRVRDWLLISWLVLVNGLTDRWMDAIRIHTRKIISNLESFTSLKVIVKPQ